MERRWACRILVNKEPKCSCAWAVWEEMITHDLISSSDSVRASQLCSIPCTKLVEIYRSCWELLVHLFHYARLNTGTLPTYLYIQVISLFLLHVSLLFYDTFIIRQLSLRLTLNLYQIVRESQQKRLIWISTAKRWQAVKHLRALNQDFPTEGSKADRLSTAPGG